MTAGHPREPGSDIDLLRETLRFDAWDVVDLVLRVASEDATAKWREKLHPSPTPEPAVTTQLFAAEPSLMRGGSGRLHRLSWWDDGRFKEDGGRRFLDADQGKNKILLLQFRHPAALSITVGGPPAHDHVRDLIVPLLGEHHQRRRYTSLVPAALAVRDVPVEELLALESGSRCMTFRFSPELALRAFGWEQVSIPKYVPRRRRTARGPIPGSSPWHSPRRRVVAELDQLGLAGAGRVARAAHISDSTPAYAPESLVGLLSLLVGIRFVTGAPFLIIGARDGERVLVPYHEETVAQLVGVCEAMGRDPRAWLRTGRLVRA